MLSANKLMTLKPLWHVGLPPVPLIPSLPLYTFIPIERGGGLNCPDLNRGCQEQAQHSMVMNRARPNAKQKDKSVLERANRLFKSVKVQSRLA